MQVPFDIKNEIVLCQQELKISMTLHQAAVQKYKNDLDNLELLSKMRKIENDIKGISRKQKPLLVWLRRELDNYQNKLKSENKPVDYAADNEYIAKQIQEHQRMADFKLYKASNSKIISCGIKNPEIEKVELKDHNVMSNESDQQAIKEPDVKRVLIETQLDVPGNRKNDELLRHLGVVPMGEIVKLEEYDSEIIYIPRVKDENRKRGSDRHKMSPRKAGDSKFEQGAVKTYLQKPFNKNESKLEEDNKNLQDNIAEKAKLEDAIKVKNDLLDRKNHLYEELPLLEDKLKELTEKEEKQRDETKRLLQEQANIENKIKSIVDFIKFVQQTSARSFPPDPAKHSP